MHFLAFSFDAISLKEPKKLVNLLHACCTHSVHKSPPIWCPSRSHIPRFPRSYVTKNMWWKICWGIWKMSHLQDYLCERNAFPSAFLWGWAAGRRWWDWGGEGFVDFIRSRGFSPCSRWATFNDNAIKNASVMLEKKTPTDTGYGEKFEKFKSLTKLLRNVRKVIRNESELLEFIAACNGWGIMNVWLACLG